MPYYRVAKRAGITVTSIAHVAKTFDFPKFLQHLQEHPYYSSRSIAVDSNTPLSIWNCLTLQTSGFSYCLTEKKTRLYTQSEIDGKEKRWDPIFYVPTKSAGVRNPELEVLHGA